MMTELTSIVSNYSTLRLLVKDLQDAGYIDVRETFEDKRKLIVSLTDKGRAVAEQLKKAEEAAMGEPIEISDQEAKDWAEEFMEATRGMSLLYHVNVFEDHVTIGQEVDGKTRVINVYVRVNGKGILRLWCEADESFDCIHVKYAWTLPKVQEMYANSVRKGNVKG